MKTRPAAALAALTLAATAFAPALSAQAAIAPKPLPPAQKPEVVKAYVIQYAPKSAAQRATRNAVVKDKKLTRQEHAKTESFLNASYILETTTVPGATDADRLRAVRAETKLNGAYVWIIPNNRVQTLSHPFGKGKGTSTLRLIGTIR